MPSAVIQKNKTKKQNKEKKGKSSQARLSAYESIVNLALLKTYWLCFDMTIQIYLGIDCQKMTSKDFF